MFKGSRLFHFDALATFQHLRPMTIANSLSDIRTGLPGKEDPYLILLIDFQKSDSNKLIELYRDRGIHANRQDLINCRIPHILNLFWVEGVEYGFSFV